MKEYLATLSSVDKAMTKAVIKQYGGEVRFTKDNGLILTVDSIELLTDSRFRNDELSKLYEKNRGQVLLYALVCVCADRHNGVGDMVKAHDSTGVLAAFTPHSFSDALYNKNDKAHTKAVGHLMRYLMQQVVNNYAKYLAA